MAETVTTPAENTNQAAVQALGNQTQAPAQTTNQAAEPAKTSSEPVSQIPTETKPVDIAYDLKVSEGSVLDAARLESIKSFAKTKGLSNEQAQLIVDREADAVKSHLDAQTQAFEARKSEWAKTALADKEIGGENLNRNIELSNRVIKRFASEALINELNVTGLGNYPELVRVFSKIGKAMGEDQLVQAAAQVGQTKSIEQIFYPNMTKG
jgi:hypothetical protein